MEQDIVAGQAVCEGQGVEAWTAILGGVTGGMTISKSTIQR